MEMVGKSKDKGSEPARVVGSSPPRTDGPDKVRGSARYVDDLRVEGAWHGATVRSPHARARIVSFDEAGATALGAVVVRASAVPAPNRLKLITADWPVLVEEIAEHVGEAVALVAAPTRELAIRAAAAVKVEWEQLPSVLDLDAALLGDPRGPAGGVLELARCGLDHGDVESALEAAPHVIDETYETGHQEHVYIEPQGMLATWLADDSLEIVGSMQCPYYVHKALGELFGLAGEHVRVRQAATGGGFGGKEDYPDMIAAHAALLARAAGHPVKLIYDRHEDIIATTKRHPSRVRHRTGYDDQGRLLAMDIEILLDGGAYTTLSPVVLSRAVLHAGGPYRCPAVRIRGRVLATNTATNGAFRGFGAPQVQFAVERQMDAIARRVGLDPWTLREVNAYRLGDVTPTGQVLDQSVSAIECLQAADERTDFRKRWRELEETRAHRLDDRGPWHGIGLALFWHGAGFTGNGERIMRAPAKLELLPKGRVRVLVSSSEFGQGTERVLPQIVADAVGVPIENVEYAQPDTAFVPDSGPTVASRTVMIVGGILEKAGRVLARRLVEHAATHGHEGADRFQGGELVNAEGKALADFDDVADAYLAAEGTLEVVERFEGDATEFDEKTYQGTAYAAFGWGCNVIEIDVDPDTLSVRPRKLTMIADVGKAIHPTLCAGQVEGGTLQAIAWGYLEEIRMRDGHYLNDSMQTCLIPTALDAPQMETVLLENPAAVGPFGAKGVGELPMDGGAPAIVAAIENATGVVMHAIPATPERLLEALEPVDFTGAIR